MSDLPAVAMNTETHRFEAVVDGVTAFAEYRLEPGVMTLPHTVVPGPLEGRGIAGALAEAALGYAREKGLKVKPVCAFMAAHIRRHYEWADIVHPDFRAQLGL